ncbi:M56 family metallopeptidase [Paenibacillus albidus]|uniref:M56 family metallopeptidase n=1 Tax=Paenibacillus albidus TaxID=2041023 RepID=UPI00288BA029|nr:M56 family metallopeptidase [Paenibacillus albidus]
MWPVILLPPVKLSDDALYLILRHELIHLKMHDLWYKAMILTATAFHWSTTLICAYPVVLNERA